MGKADEDSVSRMEQIALDEPQSKAQKRLSIVSPPKREHGKNLYVKIIIPEDSGLTYNEAWEFMRSLLVKYDYYYQE